MPEWMTVDHVPPGADLMEAEAEMVIVDVQCGGEAVLMELADGTQLVFRGDELRRLVEPSRVERAA